MINTVWRGMIWRFDSVAMISVDTGRLSWFHRDWYASVQIGHTRVAEFWKSPRYGKGWCPPSNDEFQGYCQDCRLLSLEKPIWASVDGIPWEIHAIDDDAARLTATRSFLNSSGLSAVLAGHDQARIS